MSIAEGRAYFRALGLEDRVQEFTVSSATVDLAAAALFREHVPDLPETIMFAGVQYQLILDEENGVYIISAEVFGTGINMWLRSQGTYVEVIQ